MRKKANIELSIYPNPVVNHTAIITLKNAPIAQYNVAVKNYKRRNCICKKYQSNCGK